VNKCKKFSVDDPGLLFDWHDSNLTMFIASANNLMGIPQPPWILTPQGGMNLDSFKSNLVGHLALSGGGSFGSVLVAPNDLVQYANVTVQLARVELDPFVQAAAAALPVGAFLASMAQVTDKTHCHGTPCARLAPFAPFVHIFA
jgi:hypothetical protein